ncbi:PREDICTED: U-box domain-containing [Prunus dulcis]|uniref:PREDICTED: U-box domain-containing n=1 Tax=Prunus dulcis TaxID=3755 RepID=A0A5E4F7M7_PRUDU|nr:PREDICTED: U-box domain-containing [Prunus dulcis]
MLAPIDPMESDCNNEKSRVFQMTLSHRTRLLISCTSDNFDNMIRQLIVDLEAGSIKERKQAAMKVKLLIKNMSENRLRKRKTNPRSLDFHMAVVC